MTSPISRGGFHATSQIEKTDHFANRRYRMLVLVCLATLFGLAVWFTPNAIGGSLQNEYGFTSSHIAWLTIGVQLGFVLGTLVIAFFNLADLLNPRRLFLLCALLAGATNLAFLLESFGFGGIFASRFLCGAFLGGVYPMGMKIMAGWFQSGRGIAIGFLIGALTLGAGSPHLLQTLFSSHWQVTVYASSLLAVLAGMIIILFVRDGPYEVPAQRFYPRYALETFKYRPTRLVLLGYLGHQWELYGMWAWVPVFLAQRIEIHAGSWDAAQLITFGVFIAGAFGCIIGGYVAEKYGRPLETAWAMAVSGSIALVVGFIPENWGVFIALLVIFWGASVIADSAQFSTALTELSLPEYRGTALTFQTGIGFIITIITIRIVPILADSAGWGIAFACLSIGPVLGAIAMLRLRSLPEAAMLIHGQQIASAFIQRHIVKPD